MPAQRDGRKPAEEEAQLVSVILPTHNAQEFVERAMNSVLNQTYPYTELIVVDDSSTDNTVEVVRRAATQDRRVHLIERHANGGPSAARNTGLARAVGEWIALIDADDLWRPERLDRLIRLAVPAVDWVIDGLMGFDAHLRRETGPLLNVPPAWGPTLAEFLAAPTARYPFALYSSQPLMRRRFLVEHDLRWDESLRVGEDLVLGARMLLEGALGNSTTESLYVYTTPVGEFSRKPSGGSRRVPQDAEVLMAALEAICRQYAERGDQLRPIRACIDYLGDRASVHEFRCAAKQRDAMKMAKMLIFQRSIRRDIVRKALRELVRLTRNWSATRLPSPPCRIP